ncbi:MAG TPA: EF-P lysine aminoacylase EpmA [Thermoanaerobaculia bacterium]|nr:EF-P lysine aminoacylase EpmA [Thermoanaerobaculia bacterium]
MSGGDWRPTASVETLRLRARLLAAVRAFFAERGVLEVETPCLGAAAVTDPHLQSLATCLAAVGSQRTLYLQTSPEYAMKRLLAAGSGPIYQLARAFRDGETGRRHNPEFTLLEWYRPGFDHHRLMDEVEELLAATLGGSAAPAGAAERITYAEAFRRHAAIDPFAEPAERLAETARRGAAGAVPDLGEDRDSWLDLLMGTAVTPALGRGRPTFVYDFPASQAALARLRESDPEGGPAVAERFELFIEGMELANGFHELTDRAEQHRRFERDLARRRARGLPEPPVDDRLLAALGSGLPDCAGVALGFDRLVMLAAGAAAIDQVLAFPIDRA